MTVPESVTVLGSFAFADCVSLTTATVNANVNTMFGGWFAGCSHLTTLTIPFVGSNIDSSAASETAFGYVFGMSSEDASAFAAIQQGEHTYYIPRSLRTVTVLRGSIEEGAFDGCSMLTAITAEEGCTVNAHTFSGCNVTIA